MMCVPCLLRTFFRMDSFVLAETFKYFYLTFAEEEDIGIPIDDYVLTTEAHLIPLHVQFFSKEQVRVENLKPPNTLCSVLSLVGQGGWFTAHIFCRA